MFLLGRLGGCRGGGDGGGGRPGGGGGCLGWGQGASAGELEVRGGGSGGEFELCVGSARLSAAPTQSAAIIICPPPGHTPGILLPRGHVINEVEVS